MSEACWLRNCPCQTGLCLSSQPTDDGCPVYRWFKEVFENKWISVKERLPENRKNVLVCLYDNRRRKVSNYTDGKRKTIRIDKIISEYGEPFWAKGNTLNVIAWMPLPSVEGLDGT